MPRQVGFSRNALASTPLASAFRVCGRTLPHPAGATVAKRALQGESDRRLPVGCMRKLQVLCGAANLIRVRDVTKAAEPAGFGFCRSLPIRVRNCGGVGRLTGTLCNITAAASRGSWRRAFWRPGEMRTAPTSCRRPLQSATSRRMRRSELQSLLSSALSCGRESHATLAGTSLCPCFFSFDHHRLAAAPRLRTLTLPFVSMPTLDLEAVAERERRRTRRKRCGRTSAASPRLSSCTSSRGRTWRQRACKLASPTHLPSLRDALGICSVRPVNTDTVVVIL
jgi:hypothetical protein